MHNRYNKYYISNIFKSYKKGSHISRPKFREILRLFLLDIEATKISEITKISCPTVNKIFMEIRKTIARDCDEQSIL